MGGEGIFQKHLWDFSHVDLTMSDEAAMVVLEAEEDCDGYIFVSAHAREEGKVFKGEGGGDQRCVFQCLQRSSKSGGDFAPSSTKF